MWIEFAYNVLFTTYMNWVHVKYPDIEKKIQTSNVYSK